MFSNRGTGCNKAWALDPELLLLLSPSGYPIPLEGKLFPLQAFRTYSNRGGMLLRKNYKITSIASGRVVFVFRMGGHQLQRAIWVRGM